MILSAEAMKTRRNLAGTAAEFASSIPAPLGLVMPEVLSSDAAGTGEIAESASRACASLESLDAALAGLSPEQLSSACQTLVREEAVCSAELASQVPAAMDHAPLSERLSYSDDGTPDRLDCSASIEEDARNIARAMEYVSWRVHDLPLSGRLLQEAHGIALQSARYDAATPGWFRTSPIWMGNPGSGPDDAMFVAPNVEDMAEAWRDLERHMNGEAGGQEGLVEVALEHYQFEAIHPFLDGNGRVGRIAAIQSLVERGLLSAPVLPLSWAFEQDSFGYFAAFLAVQQQNDYRAWTLMFTRAVDRAARHALRVIERVSLSADASLAGSR